MATVSIANSFNVSKWNKIKNALTIEISWELLSPHSHPTSMGPTITVVNNVSGLAACHSCFIKNHGVTLQQLQKQWYLL